MSYTDLRDFSEEFSGHFDTGIIVRVEKLGGGTLGKRYTGTWRYIATLSENGAEIARGQDYECGMPKSHSEAAMAIAELVNACPCGDGKWSAGLRGAAIQSHAFDCTEIPAVGPEADAAWLDYRTDQLS